MLREEKKCVRRSSVQQHTTWATMRKVAGGRKRLLRVFNVIHLVVFTATLVAIFVSLAVLSVLALPQHVAGRLGTPPHTLKPRWLLTLPTAPAAGLLS